MCNFLSAIGFKSGAVFTSEYTDRHDLLVKTHGLHETPAPRDNGWVKLEYTSDTLTDISTYKLTIDETDVPSWVTDEIREKWERKMHAIVKRSILLTGEIPCLLGGKYVLGGDVRIEEAHGVWIVAMYGSSQVGKMHNSSQVGTMWDSSTKNKEGKP